MLKKIMPIIITIFIISLPACRIIHRFDEYDEKDNGVPTTILVTQDTTTLNSNSGVYNFGTFQSGTTSDEIIFTITNYSLEVIDLTNDPVIVLSDSTNFTQSLPAITSFAPGNFITFGITFNPTTAGEHSSNVSIFTTSDDFPEYIFSVIGNSALPEPEINIQIKSANYDNESTFYAGSITQKNSLTNQITIENTGHADLSITSITITGTNASEFSIDNPTDPRGTVAQDKTTTFDLVFTPSDTIGTKTAILTILSNDTDEGTYTINITATSTIAAVPEISVVINSSVHPYGNPIDFETIILTDSTTDTITIANIGDGDLNITNITIQGTDSTDFKLPTTLPTGTITGPGGTVDLVIIFEPSTKGTKNAYLTIENNDTDEGNYIIDLNGTATEPKINVIIDSVDQTNGDTFSFDETPIGTPISKTITVENVGDGTLSVTDVQLTGTNPSNFTLTPSAPTGDITTSTPLTFTIDFNPDASGDKTAKLTIVNNDLSDDNFILNLEGKGTKTDIDLTINSIDLENASEFSMPEVVIGTTFTVSGIITNSGTGTLNISKIEVSNNPDFNVLNLSQNDIPEGGKATFDLEFSPDDLIDEEAILTITSDDADEGTFEIRLQDVAIPAPIANISVSVGTTNLDILNEEFYYLNSIKKNETTTCTFRIKNPGETNLVLSGDPLIKIDSSPSKFSVDSQPSSNTITYGSEQTFTIKFTSDTSGLFKDNISFSFTGPNGIYSRTFSFDIHTTVLPSDNLEFEWLFNNNSNILLDTSGNGNDLSEDVNPPSRLRDRFGVESDAPYYNNSHKLAGNYNLTLGGEFTISLWASPCVLENTAFLTFYANAGSEQQLLIGLDGNAVTFAAKTNSGSIEVISDSASYKKGLMHITAVANNNSMALYVNGKSVTDAALASPINVDGGIANGVIMIGHDSEAGQNLTGYVDDVRIYTKALTESEILSLYNENSFGVIYDEIDETFISKLDAKSSLTNSSISANNGDLAPGGTILLYKTSDGNYGKMRIIKGSTSYPLIFNYTTYVSGTPTTINRASVDANTGIDLDTITGNGEDFTWYYSSPTLEILPSTGVLLYNFTQEY